MILSRRVCGVGVDLGARVLRAAGVDRAGQRVASASVQRTSDAPTPSATELARLAAAMRRGGLPRTGVWIAAPKAVQSVRGLSLPAPESGAPIDRLARAEAARLARVDPQALELALWQAPAPHRAGGLHATAVVVSHDDLRGITAAATAAGLSVRGVTPQAAAAALGAGRDSRGLQLLVDLGWSDTTLIALRDGAPSFQRSTSQSLHAVVRAMAESLDLDLEAATSTFTASHDPSSALGQIVDATVRRYGAQLAEDIEDSIAFLRSVWPADDVERVVMLGGGARTTDLDEWLVAALGVEVRRADERGPEWAAAIGAARASIGLSFAQHDGCDASSMQRRAA
ncbi:MAG: hypothetical protein AAF138_10675 [Planctomycetota bacterium]